MSVRVCHISTVHPLSDVRIVQRECRSLACSGFEVHLVIPTDVCGMQENVHIHPIRRLHNRWLRIAFMPWVALRTALKTDSMIYHFHDPELLPMCFVMRWVLGKRVVYDVHEAVSRQILSKEWLPRWSRRIISTTYRMLEALLTPGQTIVLANENCARDYGSSAYLVRNFPRLDEPPASAPRNVHRGTPPLLIYVGGVSRDRGAMIYLHLAHQLLRRGHSFRMAIIGGYAKSYGTALTAAIGAMTLQGTVTLTGRMEHAKAMELVSQATIGLCLLLPIPNYTTCLATKILEYMSLGTAVLASNFDVWRSYVEGEGAGLMADPCKLEHVVAACERMIADPDATRAMGERGYAAVRARYNWSSEFDTLKRCYDDLLPARRS